MLQVANMKLIKEGSVVFMKRICVLKTGRVAVLDERVSGLHHEKDVLLRVIVEVWIIKLHDYEDLWHCSIVA